MEVPQNGWFIKENPKTTKWMTWGYPILGNLHIHTNGIGHQIIIGPVQ